MYSSPKRNCDNEASPATTCPLIFDASLHTHACRQEKPRTTCKFAKVVRYKMPCGASHRRRLPPKRRDRCACTCSWPTSHLDSHVASLGQQSFVTVLLIMLMRPGVPRARRGALAHIKGKKKKNGEPKSLKAYEYLN